MRNSSKCLPSNRFGFTLVELSIVLIIIGLLIGGILVGQSLIDSAKINRFIKDVQSYDIATSTFKQKFKALPGDSTKFGCVNSTNVCGDGKITSLNGGHDHFNSETGTFWKNLSDSKMIEKSYSNITTSGLVMGTNMPKIDIGLTTGLIAQYSSGGGGLPIHAGKNVFVAGFFNNASNIFSYGSTTVRPSFTPATAMAIDQKMDDGNAYSGSVEGLGGLYAPVWQGISAGNNPYLYAPANSTDNCATPTNYSQYHTQSSCGLSIVMLSQAGQNQ